MPNGQRTSGVHLGRKNKTREYLVSGVVNSKGEEEWGMGNGECGMRSASLETFRIKKGGTAWPRQLSKKGFSISTYCLLPSTSCLLHVRLKAGVHPPRVEHGSSLARWKTYRRTRIVTRVSLKYSYSCHVGAASTFVRYINRIAIIRKINFAVWYRTKKRGAISLFQILDHLISKCKFISRSLCYVITRIIAPSISTTIIDYHPFHAPHDIKR